MPDLFVNCRLLTISVKCGILFLNFRDVITASWNSVRTLSIQAFVCLMCGGLGREAPWEEHNRVVLFPRALEKACWAYSFNHEGLKITNWKVFDQDVYTFNLSPGIERAKHTQKPWLLFIYTESECLPSVSEFSHIYCLPLKCRKDKKTIQMKRKEEK